MYINLSATHVVTNQMLLAGPHQRISSTGVLDLIPLTPLFDLVAPFAPSIKLFYGSLMALAILGGVYGVLIGMVKFGVAGRSSSRIEGAVASIRQGSVAAIGGFIVGPLLVLIWACSIILASKLK